MTKKLKQRYGVFWGMLLGMVLLVGCGRSPALDSPRPRETTTPSSVVTATIMAATPVLSPSPTPSPTPITPTFTALPPSKTPFPPNSIQASIPKISIKYIASTEDEAMEVARGLNFVGRKYEDPSNMCGPLAFALLRDAGVIDKYINLHDVWLLNPEGDQQLLEDIFPRDKFEWFSFREQINKFDFEAFPLKTGDLLFLYAGHSGSFQHVLTVTRVDEEGRAYSVTNVNTVEGYIIEENLLYDPAEPSAGLFYRWTNRSFLMLGRTGFGGFDLWRPKSEFPQYPGDLTLAEEIDRVINFAGGEWHVLVKSIPEGTEASLSSDGILYTRLANSKIHVASAVKVPIAMLLFSMWEDQGMAEEEIVNYIQTNGPEGRTYDQLLRAMLVKSEETAAQVLYAYLQQNMDVDAKLTAWGMEDASLYYRKFSLNNIAHLFEILYRGEAVSFTSRDIILAYMAEYTSNDDLRIGAINGSLPDDYQIYNKRGSLKDPLIVGDAAIVENPHGPDYLIALFTFQGDNPSTYEKLEAAMGDVAQIIWKYISTLE